MSQPRLSIGIQAVVLGGILSSYSLTYYPSAVVSVIALASIAIEIGILMADDVSGAIVLTLIYYGKENQYDHNIA